MKGMLINLAVTAVPGGLLYLLVILAFKLIKEEAVSFVKKHETWLSPDAICYERTAIGIAGAILFHCLDYYFLGMAIFATSVIMDAIDGKVARECKIFSKNGETLDPLCDKATILAMLLPFTFSGIMNAWAVIAFAIIEVIGQFVVRPAMKYFGLSAAATNIGKIKMALAFILTVYVMELSHAGSAMEAVNFADQLLAICIIFAFGSILSKIIPNRYYADILSVFNLICGSIGIILLLQGYYAMMAVAVLFAQFFDLFDGRMSRKYGGTKFGPWLDDIADFISFGLCPGLLVAKISGWTWPASLFAASYVMAIGYRLWRFLAKDKYDKSLRSGLFNGLPSPAGAISVLGICLIFQDAWTTLLLVGLTAWLSVSRVKFVHFREIVTSSTPKPIVVIMGTCITVVIAYCIKTNDVELLGATLLVCFGLYFALSMVQTAR